MPKIRVVLVHEYEPNPANYPEGMTPEDMARLDEENGYAELLCDNGCDNFDVRFEVVD